MNLLPDLLTKVSWGTLADWIVAAAALSAAVIARTQLRKGSSASRDQAQVARATLILEIDRDYESPNMQESRLALRALRNETEALVDCFFPRSSFDVSTEQEYKTEIDKIYNEAFSIYLNLLWRDFKQADHGPQAEGHAGTRIVGLAEMKARHVAKVNQEPGSIQPHERAGVHYQRLTRVLGWLERVGHMANEGLLPERDLIKLYDAVFLKLGAQFEGHIRERREDTGNQAWMAEFMTFRQTIIDRREQLDTDKTPRPQLLIHDEFWF